MELCTRSAENDLYIENDHVCERYLPLGMRRAICEGLIAAWLNPEIMEGDSLRLVSVSDKGIVHLTDILDERF